MCSQIGTSLSLLSASASTCCHPSLHCASQVAHLSPRYSLGSRVFKVRCMAPNGTSILAGLIVILWLFLINRPLGPGTILLLVVLNFVLMQLLLHMIFVNFLLVVSVDYGQPQIQLLQGRGTSVRSSSRPLLAVCSSLLNSTFRLQTEGPPGTGVRCSAAHANACMLDHSSWGCSPPRDM